MSYDFQKVYTLIAQTPLIHFQHDQAGATLRATEVKPKLDRYLLKCAKEENVDQEVLSSWLIKDDLGGNEAGEKKNNRKSFRYKMKIQKKGKPVDSDILLDDCKFYFGNQGSVEKKDLVFNNCEMEIICFIPTLKAFIEKHIGAFFALHNFGSRQTKGFGGFRIQHRNEDGTVQKQTDEEIEAAIQNSKQLYFYAEMPQADRTSIKSRMNHALTIYSVMKNGLNMTRYNEKTRSYRFGKRYIKGFAMRPYLDRMGEKDEIGSDKAFVKSKSHLPINSDAADAWDRDHPEYTFIRALFGLAEQYEFRDRYRNNGSTTTEKNGRTITNYTPVGVSIISCPSNSDGTPNIDPKISLEEAKKLAEIQRFASPVTIKIFSHRIYFLFNDSYKQMLGQTFLFLAFRKEGKRSDSESIRDCLLNKHYLSVPEAFDMKAFVDSFISYYNNVAKAKLGFFVEEKMEMGNPYENSRNITLKKGGE